MRQLSRNTCVIAAVSCCSLLWYSSELLVRSLMICIPSHLLELLSILCLALLTMKLCRWLLLRNIGFIVASTFARLLGVNGNFFRVGVFCRGKVGNTTRGGLLLCMRRDLRATLLLLMGLLLYVGSFDFDDDDDIAFVDCIFIGSGYVLCAKRNFVGVEKEDPIFCSTLTVVLTIVLATYSACLRSSSSLGHGAYE
jgi:hypothetical protein